MGVVCILHHTHTLIASGFFLKSNRRNTTDDFGRSSYSDLFSDLLVISEDVLYQCSMTRERAVLRRIGYMLDMYTVVLLNRDECNINVVDTIARSGTSKYEVQRCSCDSSLDVGNAEKSSTPFSPQQTTPPKALKSPRHTAHGNPTR